MYDIVINNNIKIDGQLCKFAMEQKAQNNPLVANLVMGKDEKKRRSIIQTAWKMK